VHGRWEVKPAPPLEMPTPRCGPSQEHTAATAGRRRPGAQKMHLQARPGEGPLPPPASRRL